jgi:hypothetical protein
MLSASLSCASTPTAPISNVANPIAVDSSPARGADSRVPISISIAAAPCPPSKVVACARICSRALSWPSTRPAMPIAMSSSGASENTA